MIEQKENHISVRDREVLYHIYPASWKDGGAEGSTPGWGDLKGIASKESLDYLQDLNVDALWISPFFETHSDVAKADGGYAIKDHTAIDPTFGSMEDFNALLEAVHEREVDGKKMRVYIDFVPCHVASDNPWFEASKTNNTVTLEGVDQPVDATDFFVWRDTPTNNDGAIVNAAGKVLAEKGQPYVFPVDEQGNPIINEHTSPTPPNNWMNCFDNGPAWSWDEGRQSFYLHHFSPDQPALNFSNEYVKNDILRQMDFWMAKGVDGLRVDALPFAFTNDASKDESFADNRWRTEDGTKPENPTWDSQIFDHSICQPGVVDFANDIAELSQKYSHDNIVDADAPYAKQSRDIRIIAEAIAGKQGGHQSLEEAARYVKDAHVYNDKVSGKHDINMVEHADVEQFSVEKNDTGIDSAYTTAGIAPFWTYPSAERWAHDPMWQTARGAIEEIARYFPNGTMTMNLNNHDFSRIATRVTVPDKDDIADKEGALRDALHPDPKHHQQIIEQIATLAYSVPGNYCMYYGEELGLRNATDLPNPPRDLADSRVRDKARGTMVHDSTLPNGGFSNVTNKDDLYIAMQDEYLEMAPNLQRIDPDSNLNFYKKLIHEKQNNQAFLTGSIELPVKERDQSQLFEHEGNYHDPLVAFVIKTDKPDETILCAFNMHHEPTSFIPSEIFSEEQLAGIKGLTNKDEPIMLGGYGYERVGVDIMEVKEHELQSLKNIPLLDDKERILIPLHDKNDPLVQALNHSRSGKQDIFTMGMKIDRTALNDNVKVNGSVIYDDAQTQALKLSPKQALSTMLETYPGCATDAVQRSNIMVMTPEMVATPELKNEFLEARWQAAYNDGQAPTQKKELMLSLPEQMDQELIEQYKFLIPGSNVIVGTPQSYQALYGDKAQSGDLTRVIQEQMQDQDLTHIRHKRAIIREDDGSVTVILPHTSHRVSAHDVAGADPLEAVLSHHLEEQVAAIPESILDAAPKSHDGMTQERKRMR